MPTKSLNLNQHEPLHLLYPNNCCLCKAEERIRELEDRLSKEQTLSTYWQERAENAWKRQDKNGTDLLKLHFEIKDLKRQLITYTSIEIIDLFITTYLIPTYDKQYIDAKLRCKFDKIVTEAKLNMIEMGDLK